MTTIPLRSQQHLSETTLQSQLNCIHKMHLIRLISIKKKLLRTFLDIKMKTIVFVPVHRASNAMQFQSSTQQILKKKHAID